MYTSTCQDSRRGCARLRRNCLPGSSSYEWSEVHQSTMANPLRLLNFVPETGEETVTRGPRPDDRPLFEILKENKDKKDAEFNERFKHRPPKALDEDETEFLELVRTHQKEQEKLIADEEARELEEFQAAIASRSINSEELKSSNLVKPENEKPTPGKRPARPKIQAPAIKIVPQPKKPKIEGYQKEVAPSAAVFEQPKPNVVQQGSEGPSVEDRSPVGLVSYSDESDDE